MKLMIAEKIKKYRKERDMTQDALAQALSVSPQSVSKWECGDGYPDITLLPKIANFFEVTVDELIGNDEISQREDVQKNYFHVVHKLPHDERLQLALKYHGKYPRDWHVATSLMWEIVKHHRDKLDEYRKLLDEICQRILKDCQDSTMRKSAVRAMCMICDEMDIELWLNKDTKFWSEDRIEVYEQRYELTGEEEKYWMVRNAGNFLRASMTIGRMRKHKSCYIGNPQGSVAWNTMYLNVLNGMTQDAIPDGWIGEYSMVYIRLSCAYFGLGDKENGYLYLEKAAELNRRWYSIPETALLDLGNPLFFGETKLIKNDYHVRLPNDKKLILLKGICYWHVDLAKTMTAQSGWEWFDTVRNEERWLNILAKAHKIADHV